MVRKITAIKLQSKNRNQVNIFLDGVYNFGLTKILSAGLKIGQELSSGDIAMLRRKDSEERAYKRAIRLIERRLRSEQELHLSFEGHKVPSEVQDAVLARLREMGLVDDKAFADGWVENRQQFRPRGKLALKTELRQKGVAKEVIEAALQGYDEENAAYDAAVKGSRRWRGSSLEIFRQRLGAYLARRGFDYSIITPVVIRVWDEIAGAEDESEVL